MARIRPYRDLVAKENRGDVTPHPAAAQMSEKERTFYLAEFARARQKLGSTVDELLTDGRPKHWWEVWSLFATFALWKEHHAMPVSDIEKIMASVYWLEAEVNNGGFHQYFFNPAGDLWPYVMHVLVETNDVEGIRAFEATLSIFPDGKPDTDRRKRWNQMDQMSERDEEGMWAHFRKYTDQFYKSPFPDENKLVSIIKSRKSEIHLDWPT